MHTNFVTNLIVQQGCTNRCASPSADLQLNLISLRMRHVRGKGLHTQAQAAG